MNNKTIEQPPIGFSTQLIFLKDGSYMAANRDFTGHVTYYDIVVYKYDSLGQTCNGNIPKIDTEIRDLNLHISDKSYTILDNRITIRDYSVTVTNVAESRTLCSGEMADNTKTEKKEKTFIPGTKTGLKPQLYPNPATDAIHITFEASKSALILLGIFDIEGKQVLIKTSYFAKGTTEVMLDIKSLKPGIYYVRIFDETLPVNIKFIKQ